MVGIRDVARKAGVSTSSVSLVINGTGYVSEQMRRKVEQAMSDLHYVPNALGRNLSQNRTNIVGIIVPTVRHPFFARLTAHLENVLANHGMKTMLCSTIDAATSEAEYVDMLRCRMMDGIIMGSHTEHDQTYWSSIQRPVVGFDRVLGPGIAAVNSDHLQGGNLIADLLIATGTRHVVMIGGPRQQFHDLEPDDDDAETNGKVTTFPTTQYYVQLGRRFQEPGIQHDYIDAGEVDDLAGYSYAVTSVFDDIAAGSGRYADVDAIVSSDVGASIAVQRAFACGIRIPEQVQIIAYDGTSQVDLAGMHIAAVQQDFDGLADGLVSRICSLIDGQPVEDGLIPVIWKPGQTVRTANIDV
ncbi:LacI family DNA-binding transcriptional regulator [Bifidobacterium dolichotidis]|nr:LacI family DNA-binding transcriptional regulator [Bifidobacterium dolichotidis]